MIIYILKYVVFVTSLTLLMFSDKIFGKNKKIWKIVLSILATLAALSFMY